MTKFQLDNTNRISFHTSRVFHIECEIEIPNEESTKAEVEEHIKLKHIRCAEVFVKSFSITSSNSTHSTAMKIHSTTNGSNELSGKNPNRFLNHKLQELLTLNIHFKMITLVKSCLTRKSSNQSTTLKDVFVNLAKDES